MGASVAAASAAIGLVDNIVDYRTKRKQEKEEKKALEEQQRLKEAELEAKRQQYKEEKMNLLNAKAASQRAKMGANGVDATSASSNAYVANLENDTNREIAQNNYFSELNLEKENSNYNYKNKVNLLNASKTNYDATSSAIKSVSNLFESKLW